MESARFVGYVGVPEIHDAVVAAVRESPDYVDVDLEAETGAMFTITFTGVHSLKANRPVGMLLYSLSEMESEGPGRTFRFTNSEGEDDASLEIIADAFTIANDSDIAV
jgi:hypothetical protein